MIAFTLNSTFIYVTPNIPANNNSSNGKVNQDKSGFGIRTNAFLGIRLFATGRTGKTRRHTEISYRLIDNITFSVFLVSAGWVLRLFLKSEQQVSPASAGRRICQHLR